jgi:Raf kinase inhibitor-like YbhB/YbcL family protein
MKLASHAFESHGEIPQRHTCEGLDVSPPLSWSEIPPGTKSFAIIVDDPDSPDPDSPRRTWVHWLLFDVPGTVNRLPENAEIDLPAGARVGANDWGETSYGGPCPTRGRHRYIFQLYALDTMLELQTPDKRQLVAAMRGHVLARADLVCTYEKRRP